MEYSKPPLTVKQQIELLKARNVVFENYDNAVAALSNISYYRISSYLYPYRIQNDPNQAYMPNTSFDEIIKIYSFDRKLRLLLFDSIERIEIAFRTQLISQLSMIYHPGWYYCRELFINPESFDRTIKCFKREYKISNELFIRHYKDKYSYPEFPPAWMGLDIFSFGLLSRHFENLLDKSAKQKVADYFNLRLPVFTSWMHSIAYVRNICAHHSRLWNRTLAVKPVIPHAKNLNWLTYNKVDNSRLYFFLCIIKFLLDIAHPNHSFPKKLTTLLDGYPLICLEDMRFDPNWRNDKHWAQ